METAFIDAAQGIDWDGDFVWVQRAPVLTILGQTDDGFLVRHPNGSEYLLARNEAQADYFPVREGTMLKPRYAPVKGHCLDRAARTRIAGAVVALQEGDAILNDNGKFEVVPAAIYQRDYTAVAFPGTRDKPALPFPDPA